MRRSAPRSALAEACFALYQNRWQSLDRRHLSVDQYWH
jgi:hypothetical protein